MESEGVDVRLTIPSGSASTPAVPPARTSAPSEGSPKPLPHTGVELVAVLLVAALLVALGGLLVAAARAPFTHPRP